MTIKLGLTFCALALITTHAVHADEDAIKNSSLGYDYSVDNDSNHDSVVSISHFIDEVHQVTLISNSSYTQGDSSIDVAGYSSGGYKVALENLGDTLINTGWEYEKWGKPDALTIDSLRVMVAANSKYVRLELHPQTQRIRFENVNISIAAINRTLNNIDLTSMGASLNLIWMISDAWFVDLEYFENSYYSTFQNVQSALENAECKVRYSTHLSSAANTLAATMDDNRKAVRVGWTPSWGSISADYQRAHGYISACDTDQGGVAVSVDVNDSWSVNVSAGSSTSAISERVNFASLGFNFRF